MKRQRHKTIVLDSSKQATDSLVDLILLPFEYLNTLIAFATLVLLLVGSIPIAAYRARHAQERPEKVWNDYFRLVMRWYLYAAGVRVVVENAERVPRPPTPVVLASNHPSEFDGVLLNLVAGDRPATAMIGPLPIFPFPFSYWFRNMQAIPVTRNEQEHQAYPDAYHHQAAVDTAVDYVRNHGKSLFIFPEGHLEHHRAVQPFKTGAIRIALGAGAPVIPVSIRGTERVFSWNQWILHAGTIFLTVHAPLDLTMYRTADAHKDRAMRQATYRLMRTIARDLPAYMHTPALREAVIQAGAGDPPSEESTALVAPKTRKKGG